MYVLLYFFSLLENQANQIERSVKTWSRLSLARSAVKCAPRAGQQKLFLPSNPGDQRSMLMYLSANGLAKVKQILQWLMFLSWSVCLSSVIENC